MQPSFLIKRPDSSRAGVVQFINLKFYDEDCLLRQCFTISITTIKTVTQTQTQPICLGSRDFGSGFLVSFHFRTVFGCSFLFSILAEITLYVTVSQ